MKESPSEDWSLFLAKSLEALDLESSNQAEEKSLNPNALVFRQKQPETIYWEYLVEFKRHRRETYVGLAGYPLQSYVIVEADRGTDIGRVVGRVVDGNPMYKPQRIIQSASQHNIMTLQHKAMEEFRALAYCRERVSSYELPMIVIDAEYQFDRKKLTIYFAATKRIDFRQLVRDLYGIHHTRIWLQQVETTPYWQEFLTRFNF